MRVVATRARDALLIVLRDVGPGVVHVQARWRWRLEVLSGKNDDAVSVSGCG
jgi:hypothetical protein